MKHVFRNGVCKYCNMTTAELFVLKQIVCHEHPDNKANQLQQEIDQAFTDMFGDNVEIIEAGSLTELFEQLGKRVREKRKPTNYTELREKLIKALDLAEVIHNETSTDEERDNALIMALGESPMPAQMVNMPDFPIPLIESLGRLKAKQLITMQNTLSGGRYVPTDLGKAHIDKLVNPVPEAVPVVLLDGELFKTFVRHAWHPGQNYTSISLRESYEVDQLLQLGLLELSALDNRQHIRLSVRGAAHFQKLLALPVV